jgi:predicted ABC-type ATPase
MNEEEVATKEQADQFAKDNKRRLAKELTDASIFAPDESPTSVFMAGSPGAGKTEYSKNFIRDLEERKKHKVIRIDADEFRNYIPEYTGKNSYLFQGAISIIVNAVHDLALDQKQTFLMDGTLSNYDRAAQNINRSLSRNRPVFIFYVYQKPEVAWKFTEAREVTEGRNIPKDVFIERFLSARDVIEHIRKDFDERVVIFLVKKNFETNAVEDIIKIEKDGPQIDHYIQERYTKDELEKLL